MHNKVGTSILINYGNRGGYSHEFGLMPRLVGGDSQIQAISLLKQFWSEKSEITLLFFFAFWCIN